MSEYDGSKCPKCHCENINGGAIEPEGASTAYRNCDCNDCGATWTEILTVTGFDNLSTENNRP